MKKTFKNWSISDICWLINASLAIISLGTYCGDSITSIISALTGVICVIFISKKMISNYFFGVINVSLYSYLTLESRLYGDFMLNAFYYLPMQFIGFYMWTRSKNNSNGEIESKSLSTMAKIKLALSSLAIIFISTILLQAIGGNVPFIDATCTILSIVAMMLMVKQYREQWYMWIIVNIVSIIMWAISIKQGSGDMATLLMRIIYLLNSIYGLINWRTDNKKNINNVAYIN